MVPHSLKKKKLVWFSKVKLLVGFQPNFTGVISTIPNCAYSQHFPLLVTIAINKKFVSGFHR
jgi:hypothetical protein